MSGKGPRYHRLVRGRRRLLLLSGALASLAGYVALAVLAAHQQFFAIDYGTRTWIRVLRKEAPHLPWAIVTELGSTLGVLLLIAAGMLFLLWRGQRRWALALPVLMAGAGALTTLGKWTIHRARPDESPWGFPSGHVLSLVVFFGLMIWLVATASKRRRRGRPLARAPLLPTGALGALRRLFPRPPPPSALPGGRALGTAVPLFPVSG